jgi:hypothetical protein
MTIRTLLKEWRLPSGNGKNTCKRIPVAGNNSAELVIIKEVQP